MNFLDPTEWKDLEALEKEHEVLDEELVKQLHNRLKPYFLRRTKSEVLQLPPKVISSSLSSFATNLSHLERGHCSGNYGSIAKGGVPIYSQ
jgi:hypothetical protein